VSELFTKDVLLHTLLCTAIAMVFFLVGFPWWGAALTGGSYLFLRELTQANVVVTIEDDIDGRFVRIRSDITSGWDGHEADYGVGGEEYLPGGIFTWHRTAEWLAPMIYTGMILAAI
jgi:hypothetical protein